MHYNTHSSLDSGEDVRDRVPHATFKPDPSCAVVMLCILVILTLALTPNACRRAPPAVERPAATSRPHSPAV